MRAPRITWISADDPPDAFPDVECAFDVPDGLLAAGGDLTESRILYAYRHGIFPWFNDGQPILWWSPDPRCVLLPSRFHASRRLLRAMRKSDFEIGYNQAFDDVVSYCAADRPGQQGTWITDDMRAAYRRLRAGGWAHSVEVRRDGALLGGLYGLAIGRIFFGESMFSAANDASKAAMLALCAVLEQHAFALLDCQVASPHLLSLGAELMPRRRFTAILATSCAGDERFVGWPPSGRNIVEYLA